MESSQHNPLLMSPYEFNEIMAESPIAYVPFGTVEWHGPHLPLGVDTMKIEAFTFVAASIRQWRYELVRRIRPKDY
tara:strand:- start:346 stop:573 length:228 start_codon:yes stop_codon:yes gene_type:complete